MEQPFKKQLKENWGKRRISLGIFISFQSLIFNCFVHVRSTRILKMSHNHNRNHNEVIRNEKVFIAYDYDYDYDTEIKWERGLVVIKIMIITLSEQGFYNDHTDLRLSLSLLSVNVHTMLQCVTSSFLQLWQPGYLLHAPGKTRTTLHYRWHMQDETQSHHCYPGHWCLCVCLLATADIHFYRRVEQRNEVG